MSLTIAIADLQIFAASQLDHRTIDTTQRSDEDFALVKGIGRAKSNTDSNCLHQHQEHEHFDCTMCILTLNQANNQQTVGEKKGHRT